jgi:hypothetical protein
VVAALKRSHPVLIGNGLTEEGHILVAVGYTNNGELIVNDPYGNRFAAGYGANNGDGLFYLYSCMRVKNALEVIGTYPPPTWTPTITPTATVTATVTATPTNATSVLGATHKVDTTGAGLADASGPASPLSRPGSAESALRDSRPPAASNFNKAALDPPNINTTSSRKTIARNEDNAAIWWAVALGAVVAAGLGAFAGRRRLLLQATRVPAEEDPVNVTDAS